MVFVRENFFYRKIFYRKKMPIKNTPNAIGFCF